MSIITDTLNRLHAIAKKRASSELIFQNRRTPSRTQWSHQLSKKSNHTLKLWILSFGVLVTFMTLGLSLFWIGFDTAGQYPAHPNRVLSPPEGISLPPTGANPDARVSRGLQATRPTLTQGIDPTQPPAVKLQIRKRPRPGNDPKLPIGLSSGIPKKTFVVTKASEAGDTYSQAAGKEETRDTVPAPLDLKPLAHEERLSQGILLIRKRLYSEAVEMLEPLFSIIPEDWEPWFWMGTAQMGLGDYGKAQDSFREGLARDETIPQLWVQYALVQHQRGDYGQALDLLRQAEVLAPTLPQVQLNLAFTLETQGKTKSALEHYRKYLSLTAQNRLHFSTRKKVLERLLHLK